MDQPSYRDQESEAIPRCHWHPEAETRLSCGTCGKPICNQCMVHAPVGIRCQDCGKGVRIPTFEVQPSYYARAIGAALLVTIGGGLLWGVFAFLFGGFLASVLGLGVGYATGELISRSVNRKRGAGLAWIAGGAVVAAFLLSRMVYDYPFSYMGLMFIAVGVYVAVMRVR